MRSGTFDAGEEHTAQVTKPGSVHGLADERTIGLDGKSDRVRLHRIGGNAVGGDPVGGHIGATQQPRCREHHHPDADRRHRSPTPVISNTPSGGSPSDTSRSDTTRFVDVPITVTTPPNTAAYDNGMRYGDAETRRADTT